MSGKTAPPHGALDFDIVFLHDLIWKTEVLGASTYPNLRWKIPFGSPELVCMSLRKRKYNADEKQLVGAQKFIKFFLRPDIQMLQYKYQRRIPVEPSARKKILNNDSDFSREVLNLFTKWEKEDMPWHSLDWYLKKGDAPGWEKYCQSYFDTIKNANPAPEHVLRNPTKAPGYKFNK